MQEFREFNNDVKAVLQARIVFLEEQADSADRQAKEYRDRASGCLNDALAFRASAMECRGALAKLYGEEVSSGATSINGVRSGLGMYGIPAGAGDWK